MNITVKLKNGDKIYEPVVMDGATLRREKNGASTFEFTLMNDPGATRSLSYDDKRIRIEEGDVVMVESNTLRPYKEHHNIFFGFVFRIATNKNDEVTVTAYDQIRYLKNTDTYVYSDKKLNEFLRMVCQDTQIKAGPDIMDTGYIIPNRVEENKSYLDMIMTAIELTVQNGKDEYILWDNFGEIALHNLEFFKIGLTVDKSTAEDFAFETSIDSSTYNQIKLFREKDDGVREVFVQSDQAKINKWGLLQSSEQLNKDENGDEKAKNLLNTHNKPARTWDVSGAFGDMRVRGGTTLILKLNMVDMGYKTSGYTIWDWVQVQAVTHNFQAGHHTMDLELKGGFAG